MSEVFGKAGESLELLRLDVSWARRAADFDVQVFGNSTSSLHYPRHCECSEAISGGGIASSFPAVTPRDDGMDEAWPFEVWQAMLSNPTNCFYAYVRPAEGMQVHGDIVALGGVSLGEEPEILTVGVSPAWRGQGLGGALLDLLITEAEKDERATHITLEVRADNDEALALYTSRGFTPCDTVGNASSRHCERSEAISGGEIAASRTVSAPRNDEL